MTKDYQVTSWIVSIMFVPYISTSFLVIINLIDRGIFWLEAIIHGWLWPIHLIDVILEQMLINF